MGAGSGRGRRLAAATLGVVLALTASACASSGSFRSANLTSVELEGANYELVATDVTGTASAGYLLGLSGGSGPRVNVFALARVSGPEALAASATEDLWDGFAEQHGPAEGRRLALVNVRFDVDALNLILYTRPTLHVRADVVRFEPRASPEDEGG